MVSFKDGSSSASDADIIRTQIESLLEIMLVQVFLSFPRSLFLLIFVLLYHHLFVPYLFYFSTLLIYSDLSHIFNFSSFIFAAHFDFILFLTSLLRTMLSLSTIFLIFHFFSFTFDDYLRTEFT